MLLARQSGLLLQFVERVRPECLRDFVRCQSPVLACADPGVHVLAIAILAELIEQTAQASPGKAAATEEPTQQATETPRHAAEATPLSAQHASQTTA